MRFSRLVETLVCAVILALAPTALLMAGCGGGGATTEDDRPDPKIVAAAEDRVAEEEINAPDKAEARSWLQEPSHVIFEGSKETARKLVDDLYTAGATEVYVTGISEFGASELTASLVAVLPQTPEVRRKVFEVQAAYAREIEEEPAPDVGQKYLRFIFD
jgi:hypothetical protein